MTGYILNFIIKAWRFIVGKYHIHFYKNKKGKQPVKEYLEDLMKQNSKDSRIKSSKILDYIDMLSEHGTQISEPYIKHIEGEIWELRPLRDRIFFVAWIDNTFVLLHHFMKKTQKTPKDEIEKAKSALLDLYERGIENE